MELYKNQEIKLVESFDQLSTGMRVLDKKCSYCKTTCIVILGNLTINCLGYRLYEAIGCFPSNCFLDPSFIKEIDFAMTTAIGQKRVFRFVDFDNNSQFEQQELNKYHEDMKNVRCEEAGRVLKRVSREHTR